MSFESVNKVQFINFTISEIDTFYAIPSWYIAPFSDSILKAYRETSSSLDATLSTASLSPNANITLLLKDTSKVYKVSVCYSHNEKIGSGRCAGSNILIDSICVNGISKGGKIIEIIK